MSQKLFRFNLNKKFSNFVFLSWQSEAFGNDLVAINYKRPKRRNKQRKRAKKESRVSLKDLSVSVNFPKVKNIPEAINLGMSFINFFGKGRRSRRQNRQVYQNARGGDWSHWISGNSDNGLINRDRYNGPKRRNNRNRDAYARNYYGAGQHPSFRRSRHGGKTKNGSSYYRSYPSYASPSHPRNANLPNYYNHYQDRYNSHSRGNYSSEQNRGFSGMKGLVGQLQNIFGGGSGIKRILGGIMGEMHQYTKKLPKKDQQKMNQDLGALASFGRQFSGGRDFPIFANGGGLSDIFKNFQGLLNGARGFSYGENKEEGNESFRSKLQKFLENNNLKNYKYSKAQSEDIVRTYLEFSPKVIMNIFKNIKENKNNKEEKTNEIFIKTLTLKTRIRQVKIMSTIEKSNNFKDLFKNLKMGSDTIREFIQELGYEYKKESQAILNHH